MEENTKEQENFEKIKRFFESDMKIKEALLKLAPTEKDDFNEESRIKYADKLYKELRDLELEFIEGVKNFGFDPIITTIIKSHFAKAREAFLLSRYEPGVIQKLYREHFTNMSPRLIEEVKEEFIGYTIFGKNLGKCIKESRTINELLHVLHSYIANNEEMLKNLPVIATKENAEKYSITLYGEETELSKKIFEEFPLELDCGWTEIVSMTDKILMMVRDRGHALTIDIDTAKKDDILVRYFVPKLCNRDMVEVLPGVNKAGISESGATGLFQTSGEELPKALFDFIGKVPMDHDIPNDWHIITPEEIEIFFPEEEAKENAIVFHAEEAKGIAMEQGENGRKTGALVNLQEKLKDAINKMKNNVKGKDSQQIGGNTNDGTNRD